MAKTGIRHIAENLQILSIQYKNKNFEETKKTNKSKVQKSEKRRNRKIEIQINEICHKAT